MHVTLPICMLYKMTSPLARQLQLRTIRSDWLDADHARCRHGLATRNLLFAITVSAGIFGLLILKQQNDRWLSAASGVEVATTVNAVTRAKHGETSDMFHAAETQSDKILDDSATQSIADPVAPGSNDTMTPAKRRCLDAMDRGKAFLAERRTGNAIILLRQAIGFDPACAEAHYYLGMAHAMHGDRAAARAQRDTLMQLDPNLASLLDNLVR